jgi:hypothetical protein
VRLNSDAARGLQRRGRRLEAICLLGWTDRGQDQQERRKSQRIPKLGQAFVSSHNDRCLPDSMKKPVRSRVSSFSLPLRQKSPVTSHSYSAEQVQNQQDDQDQPDNPYAAARTPSPISVIAAAAPEQEYKNNDQQNQQHWNLLSVSN